MSTKHSGASARQPKLTAEPIGDRLFTFAVISDSHLEPEPSGKGAAPRSNERNRYVVQELNRLTPQFVIHTGDMVNPRLGGADYSPAAEAVKNIYADLKCELFLTPGNVDIGDKPEPWETRFSVCQEWVETYRKHFGKQYYAFDHKDIHFIVADSCILNSGLPCETEQREWLEKDLADNAGKRIFLFTHYPPYLLDPDEDSHYDNIDEPARSWLLGLIESHDVEALFTGHVHRFFYNRHGASHHYVAPSTSVTRVDYSELFRDRPHPDAEYGNNETGKLGYFLVHVHEGGHVPELIRTDGRLPADARQGKHLGAGAHFPATSLVGVHLNHPWSEIVEMPYGRPMMAFGGRRVRNDYPIQAIWELSLRDLRIPLYNLRDRSTRERMAALVSQGHAFTVFTMDIPDAKTRDILIEHAGLVSAWEVILPYRRIGEAADALRRVKDATGARIVVAKIPGYGGKNLERATTWQEAQRLDGQFESREPGAAAELLEVPELKGVIDGFSYRIELDTGPFAGVSRIGDMARSMGLQGAKATVCLAYHKSMSYWNFRPSTESFIDDMTAANRVAETLVAAAQNRNVSVFLDTFMTHDRDAFPRPGLVDRQYDLTLAGRVFYHLQAAMKDLPDGMAWSELALGADGKALVGVAGDVSAAVLLPARPGVELDISPVVPKGCRRGQAIDLSGGGIENLSVDALLEKPTGSGALRIDGPVMNVFDGRG